MTIFAVISIVLTALLMFSKSIWDRLLALSSLGIKVSILITLVAFMSGVDYVVDVAILYLVVSGAGMMVILAFLIKGEME